MNQSPYKVELLTGHDTDRVLAELRRSPLYKTSPKILLSGGIEIVGSFELCARDAKTQEKEWEHQQANLLTDLGRRQWFDNRFVPNYNIGFMPSKEQPMVGRCAVPTDVSQVVASGAVGSSTNSVTYTRTMSTTFGQPGSNRTLGSIWLTWYNTSFNANVGPHLIIAYALLTPPKVQTTTQTLEVVYKFTMNPIY